jgi:NDP-sugar pyrophosphorylase family protein
MNRFDQFLSINLPKYIENQLIDEIIISDENGEDIKKIKEAFPNCNKLKLFVNEKRLGPFLNKMNACQKAKNEWLVLMDSDNFADIDYFEIVNNYVLNKNLSKTTILAPCWAKPRFNYSHLSGEIFKKGNFKKIKNKEKNLSEGYFNSQTLMNTGNYVLNKYIIDNLDLTNEFKNLQFSHSCDVIYMNTLFFEQYDTMELRVLENLHYSHIVHNGSVYVQYHSKFRNFNNFIYNRYNKLE